MNETAIFAFVLVLIAAASGVVAWTTLGLHTRTRRLESAQSSNVSALRGFASKLAELERTREARSNAAILARVEDLAAAVEAAAVTQRKFQQKVYGWIGADRSAAKANGGSSESDEELQDLLALQAAPPVRPGG